MAPGIYLELGETHFHDVIRVTRRHVPEINIGNLQLISILQLSPPHCIQLSLVWSFIAENF